MATRQYIFINELQLTEDGESNNSKIKVRVSRLRKVYNPIKKEILQYVAMVLIDEEGEYIYATISPSLCERFRSKIVDGQVHMFKRFQVVPNKEDYRVVSDTKIMIKLVNNTFVKALKNDTTNIPKQRFDFITFHNLKHRRDKNSVLSDLCGVLIDKEIEKPNYFALDIEDEGGQRQRVALWDHLISEYKEQKKKLTDSSQDIIVTLTSLTVKDYKGYNSVSTTTASSVYINLDIPEVHELAEIWRKKTGRPNVGQTNVVKKDITSILEHCKTKFKEDILCYCIARIKDIDAGKSWYYPSCNTCPNKPQYNIVNYFCNKCQKTVETQTIRYCIDLKVHDSGAITYFVVFDDEAKKLIGQDAITLHESQPDEDEDDEDYNPTPSLIYNTFVGKEFLFKIKINESNHDGSSKKSFRIIEILEKNAVEDVDQSTTNSETGSKRPHSEPNDDDSSLQVASKYKRRIGNLSKQKKV